MWSDEYEVLQSGDYVLPSKNSMESVMYIASDKELVYVLSNVGDNTKPEYKHKRVVDIYNSMDGSYLKSINLPSFDENANKPLEIEVEIIYVMYEKSVKIFSM